ncbi:hypothetical protein BDQ94DRAFT_141919 [Aspergillus welwitschiae]|uniref:Uncharacterized protein n=1 Tax=Aspergillus welwitschiae TaxID=1341132 RepID=A0A3F3Q4C8_9EURO|nr:hypothetical protein BDQ94DRAFT_141919 [Aspergillus welwitschiae]RDH34028.1 hypothetical protein BDQ94DRAFT_141919 [Aspergillus welwitschiae]
MWCLLLYCVVVCWGWFVLWRVGMVFGPCQAVFLAIFPGLLLYGVTLWFTTDGVAIS